MANYTINKFTYGGNTYKFKDTIPFVAGTQTAKTGTWTGVCNDVTELYDGLTIAYWLPYAGNGSATLNLTINGTATGAKNCYYSGTSRLTTHFGAGNIIYLTYQSAANINGTTYEGWWANANYDSNTVSQLRWDYSTVTAGTAGIFPYTLIMMNSSGNYESLVTSSSTGTSKSRNTAGFVPGMILLMYANGTTTSGNKVSVSNYCIYEAYCAADGRYSFNISTTGLTVGKPIYLVGTITNGLFYLDSTWWTQALPTSDDGKVYMYLGGAYLPYSSTSDYRFNLAPYHPIFWYKNGALCKYGVYSSLSAVSNGTAESLVTTGEKYTWNNKSNLAIGTTSTTAAAGNHTHSASLATDTGTSVITLASAGKYKLTAGGSSVIFTMPAAQSIPSSMSGTTASSTTGVTIGNHSTTTIYGVGSSTTTASKVSVGSHSTDYGVTAKGSGSFTQGSFTGGSLVVTNHVLSFTPATHGADSHTHTAPTLGSKIPTVSASDITVPIKNSSTTTVVTSASHTVSDDGHTHTVTVS